MAAKRANNYDTSMNAILHDTDVTMHAGYTSPTTKHGTNVNESMQE